MSADQGWGADDYDDPYGDDLDNDWDDRDDDWEPDPEDADIARMYAEDAEHLARKHDGGECDCGPGLLTRLKWAAGRMARRTRFWRFRRALSDEPPF